MSRLAWLTTVGLFAALLAWTVAWSPTSPWSPAWTEVRPQGGKYSVTMPGNPQAETLSLPLGDGRTIRLHQIGLDKGRNVYFASYADYPQDMINSAPVEQLLANVRDGTAKGHKLLSDKIIAMVGKTGREYVILRTDEPVYTLTRSVLVGNRLYQLLVVSREGIDNDPDIAKFLDSFALTP